MRSDITTGGTFPDHELPEQGRVIRTLSEIQGEDPLILTLARGNYCPREHQRPRCRPTPTTQARSSARRSAPSGSSDIGPTGTQVGCIR